MTTLYPSLSFDLDRDHFVLWMRWVARPAKPGAEAPPENQGIRAEFQIDRASVFGPTVVFARDLETPVYMRANTRRVRELMYAAGERGFADLQLIIHGSIAQAPYVALYHQRDYEGEAIDTAKIPATPLLQVQPSIPGDTWQVSAQSNLRVRVDCQGQNPRRHLQVLR